jgi:acetyltransferase-like isoleucine patch superfamily enzyme
MILTHTHISASQILKRNQRIKRKPLYIGSDAWIGARSIIYPRVARIGEGAIIGAGAVVHENVNKWDVLFGNPATVISKRIKNPSKIHNR